MDKNFIVFFIVATAAIIAYYMIFPPPQPETAVAPQDEQIQIADAGQSETATISSVSREGMLEPSMAADASAERKTVTVESDLFKISLDTLDGAATSYYLKDYKYSLKPQFDLYAWGMSLWKGKQEEQPWDPDRLVNMIGDTSGENRVWKVVAGPESNNTIYSASAENVMVTDEAKSLTLSATLASGLEVYKTFQFYPGTYEVDFETRVVNRTGRAMQIAPKINFGAGSEAIEHESLPRPKLGCALIDGDFEKYDDGDVEEGLAISGAKWAGTMDKFFVSVAKMTDDSTFRGEYTPTNSRLNGKDVIVPALAYADSMLTLNDGQEYAKRFRMYIGPKVQSKLEDFDVQLPLSMDLGWFDFLAHPMLAILRWIQKYVSNWGVAIIILTILVRSAMFPLAYKGMGNMRKMSALNPQISKIREKYKKDKERMNKEVMAFYSQNKVNPMSGCLPMVLQFPIFIALYQALMPAIELRHAHFTLWMKDLGTHDPTLILPILMGVSMFIQQTKMPMASTATMDPTQAKMMKWMPIVMVFFFLRMPSGLVLYWVVSNFITMAQQLVFNKLTPAPQIEAPKKGPAKAKALPAKTAKGKKGGK